MKQQKLLNYMPNYPRKALRSAALTAAALVAIGGATGCKKAKAPQLQTEGLVPIFEPTPEVLVLDGEVAIPESTEEPVFQGKIAVTEPPEEVLVTDGEVAIPEPTEEELVLDGDVAICEPSPEPEITTTGMVYIPATTPEH